MLVALHAFHSAAAIAEFRRAQPQAPILLGLAGTDIYRFIASDRATVLRSLTLADALIGLHDLVKLAIPEHFGSKLHVIYQSAPSLARRPPLSRIFEVLVIGHLREEKDPLRAGLAARLLPRESRLRVTHLGRAHDASWAERAAAEMAGNRRYRWAGEVA
ncbi:MAG TPA: hypothetical protein VKT70_10930, partial [Stellaceae bacterium]|nr:hypothetical protein [Stellaceae bacterium]